MKYLPFEKYSLQTKLSMPELQKRLADKMKKPVVFELFQKPTTKFFQGQLTESGFKISRIIDYRNSFLPVITGSFENHFSHTEIKIKMRPSVFTIIFMGFWLGIVGTVCLLMIASLFLGLDKSEPGKFNPVALLPFLMFVFGYLLLMLPFKYEVKKAKPLLEKLFEAKK